METDCGPWTRNGSRRAGRSVLAQGHLCINAELPTSQPTDACRIRECLHHTAYRTVVFCSELAGKDRRSRRHTATMALNQSAKPYKAQLTLHCRKRINVSLPAVHHSKNEQQDQEEDQHKNEDRNAAARPAIYNATG